MDFGFFVLSFFQTGKCVIECSVFFIFQTGKVQITLEDLFFYCKQKSVNLIFLLLEHVLFCRMYGQPR
jgi:hypothetical protein